MRKRVTRGGILGFLSCLCMVVLLTACGGKEEMVELGYWKDTYEQAVLEYKEKYPEKENGSSSSFFPGINIPELDALKDGGSILSVLMSEGSDRVSALDSLVKKPDNTDDSPGQTTELKNLELAFQNGENISVTLEYVVDGDTIFVSYSGEQFYVRLIGCNTPESVHPEEEKNTDEGKEVSNKVKEMLKDVKTVTLEFDKQLKDDYGRVLAYVWLTETPDIGNMDNMLNFTLLKQRLAEIMSIEPNTKYAAFFEAAGR